MKGTFEHGSTTSICLQTKKSTVKGNVKEIYSKPKRSSISGTKVTDVVQCNTTSFKEKATQQYNSVDIII